MRVIAIDLGAESCRVSLAEWDGSRAVIRSVHRFPNGPVAAGGSLRWDVERILSGIEEGLRAAAAMAAGPIDSLGIDGWAVDYVRLDTAGRVLGSPFCYRDPRTESAMAEVWQRIPRERLYELTGIQFLRFNTLYQLHADRRDRLPAAARWLNIPEYALHRLGAPPIAEYTNATHTQLVDARARCWSDEIFERAGLDRSAAAPIVTPGTVLGPLRGPLAGLPALRGTQLIAPACHDTGAAVVGIAGLAEGSAFISSGTWSLVGTVLDEPCTSAEALAANFTNEGGVGGAIRFLKNVNGMWLLEECLRHWRAAGLQDTAQELAEECQRRHVAAPRARPWDATGPDGTPVPLFDVDAPELLLPDHMPARINAALQAAGRKPIDESPSNAPEFAEVIFASLAARYSQVLAALARVTGRPFQRLHIVGGGSQNAYLNRLVAEATGMEVLRGPVESATIGNAAIQFAALEAGGRAPVTAPDVSRWAARFAA